MAITNAIENFEMNINKSFIAKAKALTPNSLKPWLGRSEP